MKKYGNNPPNNVQPIDYCINYRSADIEMDCPCLLGRTLNGLTVLVQSPNSQLFLSVRLAACLFDSPAALYLFVSARICSPTTPPPNPQLLLCSKPFTSSHLPHLGLPHLLDKDLAIPRPKQEVLLVFSISACAVCDPHQESCAYHCACHLLLEQSTATAMEVMFKHSGSIGAPLS